MVYFFIFESNNDFEKEFEVLLEFVIVQGFIMINLFEYVKDMKEVEMKIIEWDGYLSFVVY